ncbi:hypothetical protein [Candidatus Uabimicrobium amorphum]|uniref:Uncharacterized protein n=1 Tax=Uabimicrobium amorphum TaxID=2596890 RepID=A0A5S9IL47_UABAM|nr:hypothetical protein [Candidatus Uabimicrobium amorphum]BBM83060.1 hypothetical protein UABAM_01410 [Candidatus Uabimicrobium amorphum]
MRTYIRRLKNCGLQGGTVSVSAFRGVVPTKLFLCIWPTDPNIKNRARFSVRRVDNNTLLVLHTVKSPAQSCVVKFDKTANVFDNDGFFWTAAKGHNFQLQTAEINHREVLFCADHVNKNRFFSDMLQVISASYRNEITLVEYLQKTFAVHEKNTYAFAIYLQVEFKREKIEFGNSCEEVYRFHSPRSILGDVNISALLYEYSKDYRPQMVSTAVDPKVIEETHSRDALESCETRHSVRDVLKTCIANFLHEKQSTKLNDDDYTCLVEDILENLSKVYDEN